MTLDLDTPVENTWCPGCGNFSILQATKMAIQELVNSGNVKPENLVMSSGIGCHAKIFDYLKINGFYSIHGRVPPTLSGMKIANPELKAVGFSGDGDAYDEGISHLIHAAKRNVDINMIIHDNRVFALTTGQFTPTSPEGFKGKSTPKGNIEKPINPLRLMLSCNASFVARGFSGQLNHLKSIFKEAIQHPGFAIIDVLQPCVTFYNLWEHYRDKVSKIGKDHDPTDFKAAWDMADTDKEEIPIGVLYKEERDTFEKLVGGEVPSVDREGPPSIDSVIEEYI